MPFPTLDQTAPDFESLDDSGAPMKLSDYRGQRVVLYFYPKADTPGCTKQACTIRDNYQLFRSQDVTVIGVSPDTVADQAAFKAKFASMASTSEDRRAEPRNSSRREPDRDHCAGSK